MSLITSGLQKRRQMSIMSSRINLGSRGAPPSPRLWTKPISPIPWLKVAHTRKKKTLNKVNKPPLRTPIPKRAIPGQKGLIITTGIIIKPLRTASTNGNHTRNARRARQVLDFGQSHKLLPPHTQSEKGYPQIKKGP